MPVNVTAEVVAPSVALNYTTALNVVFMALAAVLVRRFLKTGGPQMLRMMNKPSDHHGSASHDRGGQ